MRFCAMCYTEGKIMSNTFDIALESLTGAASSENHENPSAAPDGAAGKSFYIETFGCQMNTHDSEKVAGVLLARGSRPVSTPDDAEIIFYNTCSIREKAAQK